MSSARPPTARVAEVASPYFRREVRLAASASKGMKAQLSPILGLDEHQSPYQSGRGSSERAESRRIPSPPGMARLGRGAGEQAPEPPKIDGDVFGPSEASSGGSHRRLRPVAKPCESRSEAGRGVPFGGDRPQGPRHHWPFHQLPFSARKASRR